MPLQDVSNDHTMIDWLRQAGHSHLLDDRLPNANTTSSSSPPPSNNLYGQAASSSSYPPQSTSLSSPPPMFGGGYNSGDHQLDALHRSGSHPQTDFLQAAGYGGAASSSSQIIPGTHNFGGSPYNQQSSPLPYSSSPTQFLAPNMDQQHLDATIENMRRDPNTRVVQRPPQEDVVYKQRVFVRYLQPPTPPVGGTIIVREKQPLGPPPDPPIVYKRAPPPPPTPPPVIIRERPPPFPQAEGTTVIDKIIPPGPKPPRQVVIEQYPPLPPKPQDVIIERWLPLPPRHRRILYERLPPSAQQSTGRPIIVQYGQPHIRIQREVVTAPGAQFPYQQMTGHTDINQILSHMGGNQQIHSTLSPSSLHSYNPYSTLQPGYGAFGQSQPNIVIMQNGQPSIVPSSSYGMPLSCVCTPNPAAGLGVYGAGISTVPTMGQSAGQSIVYNVPDNIPIDGILRQLGIDPHTIQRSGSLPSTDPHSVVSHVWNAATHANPTAPNSAVSHVWNAAVHAADRNQAGSPNVGRVWDRIENYLHPPYAVNAVRSAWDHIPHPNSQPPSSNYPPSNYPPSNYPPSNYPPPPPSNYPPPPQGSYPPSPSSNYPPPSSNYPPPPQSNYPPPPQSNYPPPPPSSYPPSGGPSSAGAGVLSRLFGGGR